MQFSRNGFNRILSTGFLVVSSFFAYDAMGADSVKGTAIYRERIKLPATFAGELPCADCSGQRLVLTLFADHTFRLRRTYMGVKDGRDEDFYELGRWAYTRKDGGRLELRGGTESVHRLSVLSAERLGMLDRAGNEIRSDLNYEIERLSEIDPVPGPMRLRGMYAYMADAAIFNECLTGRRFPVSIEAAHIDVERAYMALTKDNPGSPLLVSLTGRFAKRQPDPGVAPREHLVVEQFDRILPGETCAREALAPAGLLETYWRPVEIAGKSVTLAPDQREPHFVLTGDGNRVHGSTGCNRITGSFAESTDGFRFNGLATTRMMCPPPIAELEAAFLKALNATTSHRIIGDSLELLDASGVLLMRLEATYLR
jgi:copper homeostasis protein (lipoprotein)